MFEIFHHINLTACFIRATSKKLQTEILPSIFVTTLRNYIYASLTELLPVKDNRSVAAVHVEQGRIDHAPDDSNAHAQLS